MSTHICEIRDENLNKFILEAETFPSSIWKVSYLVVDNIKYSWNLRIKVAKLLQLKCFPNPSSNKFVNDHNEIS